MIDMLVKIKERTRKKKREEEEKWPRLRAALGVETKAALREGGGVCVGEGGGIG